MHLELVSVWEIFSESLCPMHTVRFFQSYQPMCMLS